MEIKAQIIEGIKYKQRVKCSLNEIAVENFNINSAKSSCTVFDGQKRLAISKWVSPKRTRSYPCERVYNTFSTTKRVTVIPVIKDEGAAGDRDFLQWDTISLMSLPVLRLTSGGVTGVISSGSALQEQAEFFRVNHFKSRQKELMQELFTEAEENNFVITLGEI